MEAGHRKTPLCPPPYPHPRPYKARIFPLPSFCSGCLLCLEEALPMLKSYASLQGQPRCPRSLPSLLQLEGPLPAANKLPEHNVWTSLVVLTTSCLLCGASTQ